MTIYGFEDRESHRTPCASRSRQPSAVRKNQPRIHPDFHGSEDITKIRVYPCKSVAVKFAWAKNYFGCGTILKYGFGDFQPSGYFCFACSFETDPEMMTSSPGFQLTGVAT